MSKERNQRYTLADMEAGDRFYFVSDRKKVLHSMIDNKPFETIKLAGYWKRFGYCIADGNTAPDRHLANTFVIYLRNINNSQ